jgi:ribosomal protein L29
MKKDKLKELRARDVEELKSSADTLKEKLERLQFDLKSGKTAAIKDIRNMRKEIAVILTLIKEHGTKNND